jgi:hypothetical protein
MKDIDFTDTSGEDVLLARVCSNHSVLSLAVAVTTGMYRAGGFGHGKGLNDVFFDRAASRTKKQKDPDGNGRISIGILHDVGDSVAEMLNRMGVSENLFGEQISAEDWNRKYDTEEWWNKNKEGLKLVFNHCLVQGKWKVQLDMFKKDNVEVCLGMARESGNPGALTRRVIAVLARICNSYGAYLYWEKHSTLYDIMRRCGHDPFEDLLDWYGVKSNTKARRSRMMRAVLGPYTEKISEISSVVNPFMRAVSSLRDVQIVLKNLGFYEGKIDGDFGRKSDKALDEWSETVEYGWPDLNVGNNYVTPYCRELLSGTAVNSAIVTETMEVRENG